MESSRRSAQPLLGASYGAREYPTHQTVRLFRRGREQDDRFSRRRREGNAGVRRLDDERFPRSELEVLHRARNFGADAGEGGADLAADFPAVGVEIRSGKVRPAGVEKERGEIRVTE